MPLGTTYQLAGVNWLMVNGSTPTRPSALALGLATAAPTSAAPGELGTGTGLTRQTMVMATGAITNAGSAFATNASTASFGTANAAVTISGFHLWDQVASGGAMIIGGTLSAARTLASGDSLTFAVASITVTLS